MKRYPDRPGFEKDYDTSEAAAEAAIPTRAAMQRICLHHIREHEPDGLTCDEVEVLTGGAHQSISARIRDLVLNGSIYDTGDRRNTRRGRKAAVYRIKTQHIPVEGLDAPDPHPVTKDYAEVQERLW